VRDQGRPRAFPACLCGRRAQWPNLPVGAGSVRAGRRRHWPFHLHCGPTACCTLVGKAGDASWALVRHPAGLLCDLFVTHGWQEGVYEFTDKVLASWPPGARNAYCCMLANPQNLDISSLLSSPDASPFAAALRAARVVLVVPNRRGSIYARLWCVYELFLGCHLDKDIVVARAPLKPEARASLRYFAFWSCAAGVALWVTVSWLDPSTDPDLDLVPLNAVAVLLCALVRSERWQRGCNGLAGAIAAWLLCASLDAFWWCLPDRGATPLLAAHAMWASIPVAFEHQRYVAAQLRSEADLLAFAGSASDARCSNVTDEHNIRAAISDWRAVDRAVAVLMRAGASSRSLREAADAGVDVDGAGHLNLPSMCFSWTLWIWSSCYFASLPFGEMHYVDAGCSLLWLVVWLQLRSGQQAFAAKALCFFMVLRFPVIVAACTVLGGYRHRYYGVALTERLTALMLPWTLSLTALQVIFLHVSLGAVAQIPYIGPEVAHVLLLRVRRRRPPSEGGMELAARGP
jgi:hypothetical protein